ncbi:MAG: hypothetical protein JWP97_6479 [Labilithrix sp.]|nr:hypothetical protein [Labilithrix sp.]
MKRPLRLLFVAGLVLGTFAALPSCEGPEGPAGPPGGFVASEGGITDAATDTSVGIPEGGLAVGCLSPCHGFNGIVSQWQTSTHFLAQMANSDEVPTWTGPASCGGCHASDGLPRRLAGAVNPPTGGPTNVKLGETNFLSAGGAVTEIKYSGQSSIAQIACATCHDTGAANDPHLTGGVYVPGSFKLRTPSGADDQMFLEKSPTVGVVTGTPAGKWGVSNTCIGCHKSRQDVTQYITAATNVTSTHWGPHEGPHADIFSGLGGYAFPGRTYKSSTHQTLAGCASCHMAKTADNGGYPDHSMRVQVATCQTAGCHATATSFDVLGGQGTVKAALGELRGLLNDAGYLTRSAAAPYAALGPADLADTNLTLDLTRPAAGLTADQAGALYDYLLVARGAASGVHNPFYTKELVFDAVFALKGAAPAAIPVRP